VGTNSLLLIVCQNNYIMRVIYLILFGVILMSDAKKRRFFIGTSITHYTTGVGVKSCVKVFWAKWSVIPAI
jgi:hypothetical protein